MLSKQNRLQKDREFSKVFRSSRPFFAGRIVVRAMKRPDSKPSRFGFVISNKIDKRATRRNALKRRLRSSVRELLPLKDGFNVVIMVKQNYPFPYQFDEIKEDVKEALIKSQVLL